MMLVSWIPEVFCFGKHKNPKPKIHPPLNRFFLVDFFLGKGSPVPNQPVIWVFWVRFFMFLHSKKGQVIAKIGAGGVMLVGGNTIGALELRNSMV